MTLSDVVGGSLVVLALVLAGACGSGQRVISAQATVIRAHQSERFAFYAQLDERCGEESETRDEYRVCMAPARHIARTADSYARSLRAAQALLDAGDEDGFEAMLPDLVRAAGQLAAALRVAGLPIPAAVSSVLEIGAGQ